MSRSKQSTNLASISSTNVMELPVVLPPAAEQEMIGSYLGRETAKIDTLIAEQQRLIALLTEKRQAVIAQAVTKGVNPSAPMKDSGVEWLGAVPAHWDVKAIKWLTPVLRGASPRPIDDSRYFDDDGEYAWVRISDSSASDGVLLETTQQLSELGSSLSVKLEPGELFVSIAGTVGKPCIAGIKCCIHDGFVYFPRMRIDPAFLFRLFEHGACYAGLGKMGTQLNLNTEIIGSIRVGLPPCHEMTAILEYINTATGRFDGLIGEARSATTLLRERRVALISAAVTGQIDLRDATPLETAHAETAADIAS
jgi:type I restriction enzyme S subunit